jgi:hypothetical protein
MHICMHAWWVLTWSELPRCGCMQLWSGVLSPLDLAADVLGSTVATLVIYIWEQRTTSPNPLARLVDLELGVVYGIPIKRHIFGASKQRDAAGTRQH